MTYRSIIERIEQLRDQPARSGSFERFKRALDAWSVEFPEAGEGVYLVAGTNGKGSVSKTLETLLLQLDPSVGLFTSPHMMDTTERIRSYGRDLSQQEFVDTYHLIESVATQESLGHFEILTLMMVEIFFGGRVRKPVRRAVIEVGVGGRLDPTRLIPHATSIVTRIGLDHQELLGATINAIAREKFAIVNPGNVVIHAELHPDWEQALQERKLETAGQEIETKYVEAKRWPFSVLLDDQARSPQTPPEPQWILHSPWGDASLALMGERAVTNSTLALVALKEAERLAESEMPRLLQALQFVKWPCRMERFEVRGRQVYLSGDHNPQGLESLLEILRYFKWERIHIVVALAKNKEIDLAMTQIFSLENVSVTLTLTPFRPGSKELYGVWVDRAKASGGGFHHDPLQALESAVSRAGPRDLVLVTGSLYLAGFIRSQIQ